MGRSSKKGWYSPQKCQSVRDGIDIIMIWDPKYVERNGNSSKYNHCEMVSQQQLLFPCLIFTWWFDESLFILDVIVYVGGSLFFNVSFRVNGRFVWMSCHQSLGSPVFTQTCSLWVVFWSRHCEGWIGKWLLLGFAIEKVGVARPKKTHRSPKKGAAKRWKKCRREGKNGTSIGHVGRVYESLEWCGPTYCCSRFTFSV